LKKSYTFIDLFAGIGGFHTAMHSVGAHCVFASEWDKYARISYEANYKDIEPGLFEKDSSGNYKYFNEDVTKANPADIPDFDVCCGGFPCQPFSVAGLKRGFEDTRGTLFFNIANIVKYKIENGCPPKVLFLENVRGLKSHDKGNTLKVILATLEELGYGVSYTVLNAKYFGVPQNRERLFIIAWYKKAINVETFKFPYGIDADGNTIYDKTKLKEGTMPTKVSDIFEPDDAVADFTISDRMWEGHQRRKERNMANGKGFGYRKFFGDSEYCSTISARYWKDGSEILIDQADKNPRTLSPVEAGRLQGYRIIGNGWKYPECADNQNYNSANPEFRIVVSKKEAYHQFGNSVAVPVIKRLAQEIVNQLLNES
jgi:DNA-cytosine methyltransferase